MVALLILITLLGILDGGLAEAKEELCENGAGPLQCCDNGILSELTDSGLLPVPLPSTLLKLGECDVVGACQPVQVCNSDVGVIGILGPKNALPTDCGSVRIKHSNWRGTQPNNLTGSGRGVEDDPANAAICAAVDSVLKGDDCDTAAIAKELGILQNAGVDASCCNGTKCCGYANNSCLYKCSDDPKKGPCIRNGCLVIHCYK